MSGVFVHHHDVVADSIDDWKKMRPITPRGYLCRHVEQPLQIDGRLDETAWKEAVWTANFMDIEGSRKPRPRFQTRAKMLWDDTYFYVAAQLQEPHVWGTLKDHDSVIFHDNDFEVFIDPNGDNHEYYELELNALNTTWDLFLPKPYKDGGGADNGWEIPGLKTAIHVQGTLNDPGDEDLGWSVEIAIPWKVLAEFAHQAAPPREGDHWRVNFSRVQWRHQIRERKYQKVPKKREDNWVWSPQGIIDMHRPERWGYVQFTRDRSNKTRFQADAAVASRDALMTIYHHQKVFFQRHKRWAQSLKLLGLRSDDFEPLTTVPTINLTEDGYQASVTQTLPGGRQKQWRVRQDSRLRAE
ncbi:MAG: hypothetical protein CMJ75_00895 [Planctomycetaceae bacterium]|nr:hypothetical protein [Planctomycetaceae bacterium]